MSEQEPEPKVTRAQWIIVGLAVATTSGAILYKLLMGIGLGHTGGMFLGIPTVLVIILVAAAPKTKTVTGGILLGITFALLIIAPLLGEGYVCILFAAPLFYLVGIVIGLIVDAFRSHRTGTLSCVSVLILPLCLEGVVPSLTFNRAVSVEASKTVDAPEADVARALGASPRIDTRLPAFLRIGFPRPLEAHGQGLEEGAKRTIHFAGAEGDPPGDLVMRVAEHQPNYVRFETVSDSSKLTQWLRWDASEVSWRALDSRHTQVTWRLHFERELDPAWYFGPWERLAASEAAKYLIAANATPASMR